MDPVEEMVCMHAVLACRKVKKSSKLFRRNLALLGESAINGKTPPCFSRVKALCCDAAHRQSQQQNRKMFWLLRHGEEEAGEDFCRVVEDR